MDEKTLLKLWSSQRSQIISAQLAPSLVLIAIFVTASFGKFAGAADGAKYLAIGVAAATGILAAISQYAAIREAEALVLDLKKLDKPSAVAKKVGQSRGFLSLTAVAMVGLSIAVFALAVWAIMG